MKRWILLMSVMAVAFVTIGLSAETITVLPPNDTGYGSAALASLQRTLPQLEKVLGDHALCADRYFTANEWSSKDFAAYTAGTLERLGYETRLVEQAGWPDGTHVWVLVGIPVGTQTAWIPVEACPAAGKLQQVLGTIPSYTDAAGTLWFDTRYTHFDNVLTLPPNRPPVAEIRAVPGAAVARQEVTFLGVTSYDPDGEVLLYQWDLGGLATSQERTTSISFPTPGTYRIVLTVTDSRGATATAHLDFIVQKAVQASMAPAASCGCHK